MKQDETSFVLASIEFSNQLDVSEGIFCRFNDAGPQIGRLEYSEGDDNHDAGEVAVEKARGIDQAAGGTGSRNYNGDHAGLEE